MAVERAETPVRRTRAKPPIERRALPEAPVRLPEPETLFVRMLGDRAGRRAATRLHEAAREFEENHFDDARRILASIDQRAPDVAEVVELMGLSQYRLGRWTIAAKTLERFRILTGSTEQHPVLADCYRAQGRWTDVEVLWEELCERSPSAALVTEGRLVAAGALADQGRIAEAVHLLERGWSIPKRPRPHHLRRAYSLADLYERSGATPRARELFGWLRRHAPELADVLQRAESLD
jgi:tetratricopeptide (TPR) repeat protein